MLATLLKVTILHGCFSGFLNCTNAIKSRKASQIYFTVNVRLILSNIGYLPNDPPIGQTHQIYAVTLPKSTGAITTVWIESFSW